MEILSFPSLSERGPFLGSRASFLKKVEWEGKGEWKEGARKVRKALTLLMGNFDPPWFWFKKGSTQGSYFEAISGVIPYPNGSCNKTGFHIELQINAIGIGWFLLALPPKNRTCEFPRIWLKWLRFEDTRPATPYQRKPWRFAHPERGTNPSRLVRRASL